MIARNPPLYIRLMGLVVWKDKHVQAQTEMVNQYIMLREQKPFCLMVFSSKAYTGETITLLSVYNIQFFLFSVTITRPE